MQPLVFLLFVAVINVGMCLECAQDWHRFQGRCYRYGQTTASWENAQAMCQSDGAMLAEIHTRAVNNFLPSIAPYKRDTCVWLGGSDILQEGDWEWSSRPNTFYNFTNFRSGEPNNYNNGEDCLITYWPHNDWYDMPCNTNCNFICEAPASERGEPSNST